MPFGDANESNKQMPSFCMISFPPHKWAQFMLLAILSACTESEILLRSEVMHGQ